jgi:hypothetical protein
MHDIHISPYGTRSFLYAGQTFHFEQSRLEIYQTDSERLYTFVQFIIKPRFTHI